MTLIMPNLIAALAPLDDRRGGPVAAFTQLQLLGADPITYPPGFGVYSAPFNAAGATDLYLRFTATQQFIGDTAFFLVVVDPITAEVLTDQAPVSIGVTTPTVGAKRWHLDYSYPTKALIVPGIGEGIAFASLALLLFPSNRALTLEGLTITLARHRGAGVLPV